MIIKDGVKIDSTELQGYIRGKKQKYPCINLTEGAAKKSDIKIENAIIATTTYIPIQAEEKIEYIGFFENYSDFIENPEKFKINDCFHVKILPLNKDEMLNFETIKQDLGLI